MGCVLGFCFAALAMDCLMVHFCKFNRAAPISARRVHVMFALRALALRAGALTPCSSCCSKGSTAAVVARFRSGMSAQQPGSAWAPPAAAGTAPAAQAAPTPAEAGAAAAAAVSQQPRVRDYPEEPRVGVGVVILRALPPAHEPEVLLIQRGKEPNKGAGWRIVLPGNAELAQGAGILWRMPTAWLAVACITYFHEHSEAPA